MERSVDFFLPKRLSVSPPRSSIPNLPVSPNSPNIRESKIQIPTTSPISLPSVGGGEEIGRRRWRCRRRGNWGAALAGIVDLRGTASGRSRNQRWRSAVSDRSPQCSHVPRAAPRPPRCHRADGWFASAPPPPPLQQALRKIDVLHL